MHMSIHVYIYTCIWNGSTITLWNRFLLPFVDSTHGHENTSFVVVIAPPYASYVFFNLCDCVCVTNTKHRLSLFFCRLFKYVLFSLCYLLNVFPKCCCKLTYSFTDYKTCIVLYYRYWRERCVYISCNSTTKHWLFCLLQLFWI